MYSHCKVFADDTKIYDDIGNQNEIQEDLFRMQKWTEKWNLYFNVLKCKVMHIGKSNPKNPYYMKIEDEKQKLEVCDEEKDLGITFDSNLNFDKHNNNNNNNSGDFYSAIPRF